ncbi:unnamed protein product [Rotaria sp. Silwood2]|nr:unnamed protein product [Rotaria sp. Silwood2]CAF3031992.1 unnamed protein product [Rotaria sp. Silwood2]CAF3366250.1 unnamed protein product [Rotaria sp. Silwood2]CAF4102201.1 unnamed protein product [Rotaria sp. Silwood2]CAF4186388.1 unnamed protein product [Rotaria sp. Silwood2]
MSCNVADDSNITDGCESLDDETPVNTSMKENTQFISSNISTDASNNTGESVKRSASQQNKKFSKRQRL